MTQSSLQTRCPECETRFQVNDEQLSIAKGKVRCGKCMAVFNAIDHQVRDQPSTETAEKPPESESGDPSAQPSPDKTPERTDYDTDYASGFDSDDDFIFADNPEEDAAEGRYQDNTQTFSEEELSDSFLSLNENSRDGGFRDDDETTPEENVDESWAEAILEEESDSPLRGTTDDAGSPPAEKPDTAAHEKPHRNDPEPRDEETEAAPPEPSPAQDYAAGSGSESWTMEGDEPVSQSNGTAASATPDLTRSSFSATESASSPWAGLQRDPVPAYQRHHSRGRLRAALWSLVVLALAAGLIAQVTWFQFDRLSAIPELRPFYEKGCELAGCELAPLVQLDRIESRKLVVRTDPDNRNQLLVDAEIVNEADFEQPFPAIALTFSNLNGDVVAQSVFNPDEYLEGEGRQLSAMPPGTRVRIAISIRDPGRDAVNYNMAFRPNPNLD